MQFGLPPMGGLRFYLWGGGGHEPPAAQADNEYNSLLYKNSKLNTYGIIKLIKGLLNIKCVGSIKWKALSARAC